MHSNTFPSLAEVEEKNVSSLYLDIPRSEETVEACKVFVKRTTALASRRRVVIRASRPSLATLQTSSVHVMHLFRKTYKNTALFETFQHILLS